MSRRSALLLLFLGTLVLHGSAASAQYPPAEEELLVSETTVVPGGTLTLSGGGFRPEAAVRILFLSEPRLIARTAADSSGAIRAMVRIPRDAEPGRHTVEARGPDPEGRVHVLSADIRVVAGALAQTNGGMTVGTLLVALGGVGLLMTGIWFLRSRSARPPASS